MNKKLLLIDDEIYGWYMDYYVKAFENKGIEVTKCSTVDEAKNILEMEESFDIIIIDSIMPPGEWFQEEETYDGLLTGKFLAEKAKEFQPDAKIFFLTNMADPSRTESLNMFYPLFQKIDFTPKMLVCKILEYME